MGRHADFKRFSCLAAALTVALVCAACGSGATTKASATTAASAAKGTAAGFSQERCTANRAAGKVTFLTSFDYAAAASIIDVVAAKEQGYFDSVCLDVVLQPGFSSTNVASVAADKAQMTSLGSFSEVAVANSQDAALIAIAVEGQTSIEALLVENGRGISKLTDLPGKTMGVKGAIPFSLRAMLAKAKVEEKSFKQIEVGFNPITLFETEIDALPVYKSNEPGALDAAGYAGKYTTFDPQTEQIPASFAVFTTSKGFAKKHPTAVADFLRASLHGFDWATKNQDAAVQLTLKKSDPKLFFNPAGEAFRWKTESGLVRSSTPSGKPVGAIVPDKLAAELQTLVDLGVFTKGKVDAATSYDATFLNEVTKDGAVLWPF